MTQQEKKVHSFEQIFNQTQLEDKNVPGAKCFTMYGYIWEIMETPENSEKDYMVVQHEKTSKECGREWMEQHYKPVKEKESSKQRR